MRWSFLFVSAYFAFVACEKRFLVTRKYGGCLVKNKYRHERSCFGPRRTFYVFHQILFDCIRVTSFCPRMHEQNDFRSLFMCRQSCERYMKVPSLPPPPSTEAGGSDASSTTAKAKAFQNPDGFETATAPADAAAESKTESKAESDPESATESATESKTAPPVRRRGRPPARSRGRARNRLRIRRK
ncbi:uncharacterized protein LOC115631991 [Scaptodrosophila lebanonensis]|uniref:Uncharacterized protein LOC115631991 n=1 Tax=Drosophila lebanonensis TaxID=7225 RepID=A0A6J2U8G8_DROLE|nr:uncharacterized protein LOC115631991 [Scaptodrosophila lebanonensis]